MGERERERERMVVEHNHLHRVYKCVVRSPIMVSFHPPNKVVSYVQTFRVCIFRVCNPRKKKGREQTRVLLLLLLS